MFFVNVFGMEPDGTTLERPHKSGESPLPSSGGAG